MQAWLSLLWPCRWRVPRRAPHGAVAAATTAAEATASPHTKTNASRNGRSTNGSQDRATDRAVHLAGEPGYDAGFSIRQPERAEHATLNPTLLHDPAAATMSGTGRHPFEQHAASNAGGTFSGRDTFAALDAEADSPAATWIQTGTRRAEAGYQDPALGWVGVRAQAGNGGVHAAVVPGSAEAAQALNGHLTGLNAFMVEHHGQSSTVTLAPPETGTAGREADQSQGMQHGNAQQQENPAGRETSSREPDSQHSAASQRGIPALSMPADSVTQMDGSASVVALPGVHISVMA